MFYLVGASSSEPPQINIGGGGFSSPGSSNIFTTASAPPASSPPLEASDGRKRRGFGGSDTGHTREILHRSFARDEPGLNRYQTPPWTRVTARPPPVNKPEVCPLSFSATQRPAPAARIIMARPPWEREPGVAVDAATNKRKPCWKTAMLENHTSASAWTLSWMGARASGWPRSRTRPSARVKPPEGCIPGLRDLIT